MWYQTKLLGLISLVNNMFNTALPEAAVFSLLLFNTKLIKKHAR